MSLRVRNIGSLDCKAIIMCFASIYMFLIIALSHSCSIAVHQKPEIGVFYRRDMQLNVNGVKGDGVLAVPRADTYKMYIRAKGKVDLFTLTTCHREETRESLGSKPIKMTYRPMRGIEDKGSCALHFGAYEKVKGRHSWAVIDLQTKETNLAATIRCNGKEYVAQGVSICQSRAGLLQQIQFDKPVSYIKNKECPIEKIVGNMLFEYKMPKGECVHAFVAKEGDEIHRHTTVGYEAILLRSK